MLQKDFLRTFGRPNGRHDPEHLEILGPTGSGKTFLLVQILILMVMVRKSSVVFIATKKADRTVAALGWPIVSTWRDVRRHEQVIFWPRTSKTGRARRVYQAERIQELLDHLWVEDSNTIVVFDEFAYIEGLDADLKATLLMYLREGRSHGITCIMGKQRPQGVQRDMHSESVWTIGFRMGDRQDNERLAELYGNKRDWLPVISRLNRDRHEFLIAHQVSEAAYISWVDRPVNPASARRRDNSYRPR